ncbi:MAG: hypothetical protein Tsb002_20580 [Wenzhouxiangellaceae bacterium]
MTSDKSKKSAALINQITNNLLISIAPPYTYLTPPRHPRPQQIDKYMNLDHKLTQPNQFDAATAVVDVSDSNRSRLGQTLELA